MATTPIIQSTGSSSGAGTAGEGRNDLELNETVTLSDTEGDNSGESYAWSFVDKPVSSSASLTDSGTATPTFSPDKTGSYWVKCVVNGTYESTEVLAVPQGVGGRIPAFGEQTEYDASGNAVGWHEAMSKFMRGVDDHASRHERGGADEIDGDHLDIDFTPSNYTPATTPAEADNVDDLAAHLQGIDTALGSSGATDHGALTGLGDDDHTQYLLVSGSRAMSGDLDLGSNLATGATGVELTQVSSNPGGTAANTLYQDDGTNYEAGSLVWSNKAVITGETSIGEPGNEQGSIAYKGGTYDAIFKVNDFGNGRDALGVFHRHSTTEGANLLFSRAKTTDSTHAAVADNDVLADLIFSGHDGTDYNPAARIRAEVDGTVASNDMPGALVFSTTADGSNSVTEALRINSSQQSVFSGILDVSGAGGNTATPDLYLDDYLGIYGGSGTLSFITNAARSGNIDLGGHVLFREDGTETSPGVYWYGDSDTGWWHPGADTLAFSTGGTEALRINSSQQTLVPDGTAAAPSIAVGEASSGAYRVSAGVLAWSTGGTEALRLDSSQDAIFAGEVRIKGDTSGEAGATTLTNSTGIGDEVGLKAIAAPGKGTGTGPDDGSGTYFEAAQWVKIYIDTTEYWVPAVPAS